jgi:hypothetical protein
VFEVCANRKSTRTPPAGSSVFVVRVISNRQYVSLAYPDEETKRVWVAYLSSAVGDMMDAMRAKQTMVPAPLTYDTVFEQMSHYDRTELQVKSAFELSQLGCTPSQLNAFINFYAKFKDVNTRIPGIRPRHYFDLQSRQAAHLCRESCMQLLLPLSVRRDAGMLSILPKDVVRLVAMALWRTRFDVVWVSD